MPGERERASQSPGNAATSSSIATINNEPPKLKIRFGSTSAKAGSSSQLTNAAANGPATPSLTVKFNAFPSSSSSHNAALDVRSPVPTTPAATPSTNGHINGGAAGGDLSETRRASSLDASENARVKGKERATEESDRLQAERAAENARLQQEADERERLRKQLEIDLKELPDVARQHLVPLYEIIRRVVARSFTDLQSLAEILPARSDVDRKRMIIEYVVATRRQVIKLLVLLRWSRDNTKDVERSMNLISFLQRQNFQLERTVDGLKAVRDLLLNARVRNYDILTAVDVLSKGDYLRLPPIFKDAFIPPPTLTATDTLTTLRELESVIRYRLQLYEHVPLDLQRVPYRIHDGRVTFHVPSFFKASFTLGGDALTDQWYLIDFSFDFKGRGVKQRPSDVMKGHITQTCDAELAKAAQTVKDATSDQTAATLRSSGAFSRVYAILRQICQNYQIELLAHHAHQANTSPTIWQGRLGIAVSKERTSIDIQYLKPPSLRPNQYSLHFAQSCSISIPSVDVAPRPQNSVAVSDSMSRLLRRLAQASGIQAGTAADAESTLTSNASRIQCICKASPVWFDPRGKKTTQLPHALAQHALQQRETSRNVSVMIASDLRDIDDILNECFGRSQAQ